MERPPADAPSEPRATQGSGAVTERESEAVEAVMVKTMAKRRSSLLIITAVPQTFK